MYALQAILLLTVSNVFMTFAWYGHLRQKELPLWKATSVSWGIAFFEYCLMVPANRLGFNQAGLSGFQLKIIQEVITRTVFIVFAVFVLNEKFEPKYLLSFVLVLAAVYVAFRK